MDGWVSSNSQNKEFGKYATIFPNWALFKDLLQPPVDPFVKGRINFFPWSFLHLCFDVLSHSFRSCGIAFCITSYCDLTSFMIFKNIFFYQLLSPLSKTLISETKSLQKIIQLNRLPTLSPSGEVWVRKPMNE